MCKRIRKRERNKGMSERKKDKEREKGRTREPERLLLVQTESAERGLAWAGWSVRVNTGHFTSIIPQVNSTNTHPGSCVRVYMSCLLYYLTAWVHSV